MTATVSDAQGDKNHADNTATATVQVGSPGDDHRPGTDSEAGRDGEQLRPSRSSASSRSSLKGSPKLHVTLKPRKPRASSSSCLPRTAKPSSPTGTSA